jgi:hypothetical protein
MKITIRAFGDCVEVSTAEECESLIRDQFSNMPITLQCRGDSGISKLVYVDTEVTGGQLTLTDSYTFELIDLGSLFQGPKR